MRAPPRVAHALLRLLLPRHEIAEAFEGDLSEAFQRRAAESERAARWWYRGQVLTTPYLALRRAVRSYERSEARRVTRTGGGWMGGGSMGDGRVGAAIGDLRVAARSLARRPAFSGVASATLALSIGAATLLFSVVEGVLLRPLPYERPDELLTVYLTSDEWRTSDNELLRSAWDVQTMTLDHAEAFRSTPGPVRAFSAYTYRTAELESPPGGSGEAGAILVDAALFPLLGVEPGLGRLPTREELEEGAAVAVLRHETWGRRFGGDPDVLGRSFLFDGRSVTVIGVMPPGFFFPDEDGSDLWMPVPAEARAWPSFYGIARLAPEASVDDASAFFERVARRLGDEDTSRSGLGGRAVPHADSVVGSVRGGIRLLFGTALLVVLVACANVGNLFLARTSGRRRELAVRASLGAGTGSLTSTVLAEVLVVGMVGGGAGVALAAVAIGPFVEALASSLRELPRQGEIGLDPSVLFFALGATLLTITAAGLGPVLASVRDGPGGLIGGGQRAGTSVRTRRGQRLLLSVQGALTVLLVLAAALLGRSFLAAASVDLGMDARRVAVLELEADEERYDHPELVRALHEATRARVAGLPGVTSAGLASSLPSQGGVLLQRFRAEGTTPDDLASVVTVTVGPEYFSSMGITLVAGRGILPTDGTSDVTEVVVSEALAAQLFDGPDALGRRILMGDGASPEVLEVVGVAGETRQLSVFQPPSPALFYPMRKRGRARFYVTAGVEGEPEPVLELARQAMLGFAPDLELRAARSLESMLADSMRHIRLRMILMGALAALAAALAMIGIWGVVAHFLSEQTRDVGIRMALGAGVDREVGRVVAQALWPTVLGLAVGVAAAVPASSIMRGFVFEIEPADPLTFAVVTGGLLAVATLAAWIPARRTASVDPVRVLKAEA